MPIRVQVAVHQEDLPQIQELYNMDKSADEPDLELLPDHKGFYVPLPSVRPPRRFEDGVKMLLWRYPVQRPRLVLAYEGVLPTTEPNALSPVFNYHPLTDAEEQRVARCLQEFYGIRHVKYYPTISCIWQNSPDQLPIFLGGAR